MKRSAGRTTSVAASSTNCFVKQGCSFSLLISRNERRSTSLHKFRTTASFWFGTRGTQTNTTFNANPKRAGMHSRNLASVQPSKPTPLHHQLYTWGMGQHAQLGQGDKEDYTEPTVVSDLPREIIADVACGPDYTFVLLENHRAYSWGRQNPALAQPNRRDTYIYYPSLVESLVPLKLISISAGREHAIGLDKAGDVFTWGRNNFGQLGLHMKENSILPARVNDLRGKGIVNVASGLDHCVALSEDGRVWSWGFSIDGQLGHGELSEDLTIPREIESLRDKGIVQITCGPDFTAFLSSGGDLWTCGCGEAGQLGHGYRGLVYEPSLVKAPVTFSKVSAGGAHMLALTEKGEVWVWGWGQNGRLGLGDETDYLTPEKIEYFDDKEVWEISCGGGHSLVAGKNRVYSFGYGASGRLGSGYDDNQRRPIVIDFFSGKLVAGIACGLDHSVAVVQEGVEVPEDDKKV